MLGIAPKPGNLTYQEKEEEIFGDWKRGRGTYWSVRQAISGRGAH